MKNIIPIFLLLYFNTCFSQNDSLIKSFELRKTQLNHHGMIVLTSWAGASIIGSAIGYGLTNSYEEQQFYIMNGAWGTVNLAIALPGLLAKPKPSSSLYNLQQDQTKTEKIFLANAVLDLVYITGGFYLKEYAKNQSELKQQQQFNGFGNAVIIQGAGLFIFDVAMTILNNQNRKKHLHPILKNATISFSGNTFRLNYKFN